MSLKNWAIAQGIFIGLGTVEKSGKVREIADDIDTMIDEKFPKRSEAIQKRIVQILLVPLARELMKDNVEEYNKILKSELLNLER
jgi:hypothetical protein